MVLHLVRILAIAMLLAPCWPIESAGADRLQQVVAFKIDPPTLRCLGFRWYIRGDNDGDATANVVCRKAGDSAWRDALPMLRVNREVTNWDFRACACENLFAGSILRLTPDTEYEVHIGMRDPDGGEADTNGDRSNRPVPIAPKPKRTLQVYPVSEAKRHHRETRTRDEPIYTRLNDAAKDNPSHTAVNIYGRGHVVCHNRISKFWDCIAIANYGKPPHDLDLQCVAIDFCNNDLSEAVDDGIEADYGCHNVRVFQNRILNAHAGLSAQPFYGGPVYFVRNELYNITALSLKLHNWCTGLEIYHNTLIAAGRAFRSYARWQNGILRNNLFLGASGYAMRTGSPHPSTSLDYNGYRRADPKRFIKWFDGEKEERYPSLDAFAEATGFEKHGVMADFDVFVRASAPVEGTTYRADFGDLTLKPEAVAVDAGVVLPNIADHYTGNAPDLGRFEQGRPRPHYGPRKE